MTYKGMDVKAYLEHDVGVGRTVSSKTRQLHNLQNSKSPWMWSKKCIETNFLFLLEKWFPTIFSTCKSDSSSTNQVNLQQTRLASGACSHPLEKSQRGLPLKEEAKLNRVLQHDPGDQMLLSSQLNRVTEIQDQQMTLQNLEVSNPAASTGTHTL